MTSESQKSTEPWVEEHKVAFPYAYDKSAKLMGRFAQGLPSAILIDPSGTVVYRGHPNRLDNATVEAALGGALKTPLWKWPDSADAARKAFAKRQFAKALDKAPDEDVASAIREVIKGSLARLSALHQEGDYLAATEMASDLTKEFSGLPESDTAKEVLEKIKDDEQAQKILKAQQKIAKMRAGRIKKGKIPRMIDELEEIAKELPGTAAARDANAFIGELRES